MNYQLRNISSQVSRYCGWRLGHRLGAGMVPIGMLDPGDRFKAEFALATEDDEMKDEDFDDFDKVGDAVEAAKELLLLARARLPKKLRFEKLLAEWGQKERTRLPARSSAVVHEAVGYLRGAAAALGVTPGRFLEALDGAEGACAEYEVLFLTAHHAALADLRMRFEGGGDSVDDSDV